MDFQDQDLENGFESIDIRQYLALFWQWAWLIALATILAGLAAFLISQRMTPVYSASTTLYINEAPSTKATDYNSIITSERISGTYSKMLTTRPVLDEVATRLNIDVDILCRGYLRQCHQRHHPDRNHRRFHRPRPGSRHRQ